MLHVSAQENTKPREIKRETRCLLLNCSTREDSPNRLRSYFWMSYIPIFNTDFSAWDYLLPLYCFTDGLTTIIVAMSGLGVGARGVDNVVCSGFCERDLLPRILWDTGVSFPWGASYRVDSLEGFTRPSFGPCVRSPLQRKHKGAILKSGIGGIAEYHSTEVMPGWDYITS